MDNIEQRYLSRGVSATKKDLHGIVDQLNPGLFPGAFCKINEDFLTGNNDKCAIIHSDGCGTKALIAYLHYKETGDASVFRGIAQDSIVMNIDDLLCVGAYDNILLSNTINRNAKNVPIDVIQELILGTGFFIDHLKSLGINIYSGGGETADVGDITPTFSVDTCAVAVMERAKVVDNQNIKPGLSIIGLASYGKAVYEGKENSGIGCNGLTSARHDILSSYYKEKYPETFDVNIPSHLAYMGSYKLEDKLPDSHLTIGEALLSPTRTYAPVIASILRTCPEKVIGLVHCSGGGQTKCLRFGQGVHFIKKNLLPLPPIFRAIQRLQPTTPRELFQVFNMGHRMEIYCEPTHTDDLLNIIKAFNIEAAIIGHTEGSKLGSQANHLTITHDQNTIEFSL